MSKNWLHWHFFHFQVYCYIKTRLTPLYSGRVSWYLTLQNEFLLQELSSHTKNLAGRTQRNENKTRGEKELPVWITGNVKHFDQNNDFVSEDESTKRILIILHLLALTLLVTCTILTEKCWNISSISVKYRTFLSKNGKLIMFIYF